MSINNGTESGYNYFGARYYTDNIMMWLSVDPMSDMRPGVSPYSYCQNNPIGRIDPSGALDGDYYTWNGKYLGSDGNDDGKVYFVSDKSSIKNIKHNATTQISDVKVDFSTTKSILEEVSSVDERTVRNGNVREEATFINTIGEPYKGQGNDIRELKWEETPSVNVEYSGELDVTIHSHLSYIRTNPNGNGEIKYSDALVPSGADKLNKANLNIITGPLGEPSWHPIGTGDSGYWQSAKPGTAFYNTKWEPIGQISRKNLNNILSH